MQFTIKTPEKEIVVKPSTVAGYLEISMAERGIPQAGNYYLNAVISHAEAGALIAAIEAAAGEKAGA